MVPPSWVPMAGSIRTWTYPLVPDHIILPCLDDGTAICSNGFWDRMVDRVLAIGRQECATVVAVESKESFVVIPWVLGPLSSGGCVQYMKLSCPCSEREKIQKRQQRETLYA